jgi:hypothetical protein
VNEKLKLTKAQAKALRRLAELGPIDDMSNHIHQYVTARSLVERGLASWKRLSLHTSNGVEWEIEITDKGRAVYVSWEGTTAWLRMTGASR